MIVSHSTCASKMGVYDWSWWTGIKGGAVPPLMYLTCYKIQRQIYKITVHLRVLALQK